jgi:hypothetical protein
MVVAALSACSGDGIASLPEDLTHAVALRSCNDIVVFITPEPAGEVVPPYLQIVLPHAAVQDLAGRGWHLTDDVASPAEARYCRDWEDCSAFQDGEVRVREVGADTTISLDAALDYGGPFRLEGAFEARWISTRGICR